MSANNQHPLLPAIAELMANDWDKTAALLGAHNDKTGKVAMHVCANHLRRAVGLPEVDIFDIPEHPQVIPH